jgi:hypothetical protein
MSESSRVTTRASAVFLVLGLAVGLVLASATPAEAVSRRTSILIKKLDKAPERAVGYDRDLFRHWVDADGDGCDTRREVLIAESLSPVRVGSGCTLVGGRWRSAYDGVVTTESSSFDIDHLVPLAEAWRSGADRWNATTREAFANDLGFIDSLIAVTASTNRSKGDRDPSDWMPPATSFRCDYITSWVQVKFRWRLAMDAGERRAVRSITKSCGNPRIEVPKRARISRG